MPDAFLHRRSVFDKHKDAYGFKDPLKQRAVSRSWNNPITRRKREKSIQSWANSFAGKRHYRKLSRHNALHLHEDNSMNASLTEICDALNRYACSRRLPYKADILSGADDPHIVLYNNRRTLDISYNKDKDLEVYKATDVVGAPSYVLTHWSDLRELAARLLGIMDRHANEGFICEKLEYVKGYKNSKGEDAPWVIRSHDNGRILASFASKKDAEQHLARMQRYSKGESMSLKQVLRESKMKKLGEAFGAVRHIEEITPIVKDAFAAASVKNFKLDQVLPHIAKDGGPDLLDIWVVDLDGNDVETSWRILPSVVVEYKTDLSTGDSDVVSEMPVESPEAVKSCLIDVFKKLDKAMEAPSKKGESESENYRDSVIAQILDEPSAASFGIERSRLASMSIAELEQVYSDLINGEPQVYGFSESKNEDSDIRTLIAAAAKSAWSSSRASDFKLDITKLDDCVRIRAMGPKGENNIGVWWVVSPDEDTAEMHIDQYAEWGEKPYEQEPERSWTAKDYDSFEDSLVDEFKALQDTIDVGKEN